MAFSPEPEGGFPAGTVSATPVLLGFGGRPFFDSAGFAGADEVAGGLVTPAVPLVGEGLVVA